MARMEGSQHGCSDGGPPLYHTEYELSRILDAIEALEKVPIAGRWPTMDKLVWSLLPHETKMDFNWSKWSYRAP